MPFRNSLAVVLLFGCASLAHAAAYDIEEATTAIETKQYTKAIRILEVALKKNPQNERARYNLAVAYFNSGNLPAGARHFEWLIAHSERLNDIAAYSYATALVSVGRRDQARKHFEAVANHAPQGRLRSAAAEALTRLEDSQSVAKKLMDEALDKLSAGDVDGALSVIERSLQEKQTGQGLIAKALILEKLERFSEAAATAELATQTSLPSPLRSQARAIAERNRNLDEGRLAGWVGFSMDLGYDSNLLAPVTQAQNNMTSGAFFDAKAGVGVPLFQWASFNGTLAYQLQVQDAIGPSRNALVLTHYIEPSFAWESSSVQFLAAPYASTFYLGTENFDYIVGGLGRLKLTTPGGSSWLGEAALERELATQDDYPTLNGWNYRVKFQWNRTLGAWTPAVRAGFERNNSYLYRPSITLSEAYMAYQFGFDLRWDFSSHFAITGRHLYALKDFLSAPSSSTTGTGHDLEGSWKLSYAPTATFEVGAIYEASYLTLLGSRYFSWAAFTTLAWKLNYYLGGI